MTRKILISLIVIGLIALGFIYMQPIAARAAAQAANLDQCRNGGLANPQTFVQCINSAWVNGNAGASNSHYREGESISYRVAVTGLNPGDNVVLILGYDVIHSSHYAIDYLTSNDRWQPPETSAAATPDVPCSGVSPCAGPTLATIPLPPGSIHVDPTKTLASGQCIGTTTTGSGPLQPATSYGNLSAAEHQMEFYNISGTPSISYIGTPPNFSAPSGGDQEEQIQLTFTAASSQVEISWGGHIASRLDWGCADQPMSAGGINGSPYHMRLKDLYVNNVFVNLGNQDRSLAAAAVLVPPEITLTKTPSPADICSGTSTSVTYSYVVDNTGGIAVSGKVVDDNGTPSNTADDVTVGTFTNLAAGASQTFTHTFTVSSTVTNTATATATTSQGLSTTATASATVTAHTCKVSITKTPSVTDICNSDNTKVTYTYKVTNNSDFFSFTGSVTDDKLSSVGSTGTLAPGASVELTASGTLNGTVTNKGTVSGTFGDAASTSASASATATVTGHDCTVSITKTPSVNDICNSDNTKVTYTYKVTNNSDFFNFTGSVTDDKLGSVGSVGPLAPGASVELTASGTLNGTVTNKGTVSGTFDDAASSSASASATATVTGHDCTVSITKTPSVADICDGSNTSVTYTYKVTNNSDFFSFTGSVSDDKLGSVGSVGPLAPGASVELTASGTLNGTVTNKGTVSGSFDDAASSSASASATTTVTGHDCTVSITKTPSVSDICDGSNTSVTYTYKVTNNSDFFNFSGSVTDDKLGTVGSTGTLAPGASVELTASGTLNGTVKNTGTVSGTFSDGSSASATASATVTGHDCTISITKTPSVTTVCSGANTQVTYTYVVTNNSDLFNVSGSVNDDQLGSIGSFGPLAPGKSATLTKVATINSTTTNTATATGTFDDVSKTSATATASATVTAGACAQITPTNTSCSTFASGSASTLTQLLYTVQSGNINSVAPGVFFYWIGVQAPAGSNTFTNQQAITSGNFDSHYFAIAAGSNVYDSSCTAVSGDSITQSGQNVTVTFNAASAGTYYIGIKYDSTSVKGFPVPNPTTVNYVFTMLDSSNALLTGSTEGLDLAKK